MERSGASETRRFHPWLVVLPLIVVCVVLVSWKRENSKQSTNFASSLVSIYSLIDDGQDDDCACTLDTVCSVDGNPISGGIDFVQYFTDFKLPNGEYNESETGQVGYSSISSTVGSYKVYFLSEKNKALFDESPSSYLPAWGAYCAKGISMEYCPDYTWSADCLGPPGLANSWTIINGTLYFFDGAGAKDAFMINPTVNIPLGNDRWSKWFPDDPYENMNTECHYAKGTAPHGR